MWPCVQAKTGSPQLRQARTELVPSYRGTKPSVLHCTQYVLLYTLTGEETSFPLTLSRERDIENGGCDEINGYYEV